jgi:hypothetical protein
LQNKLSNPFGISRNILDIIRFPNNQAVTPKTEDEIQWVLYKANTTHKEYKSKTLTAKTTVMECLKNQQYALHFHFKMF